MGCCSSREASTSPAENGASQPPTRQARLVVNHIPTSQSIISDTLLSPGANVHWPATNRAALNTTSQTPLPSTSTVSASGQSTSRHRHRGTTEATSSNLSEHYNLPLQRPKPWKAKSRTWTPSQLHRERQDFFDTRVAGQNEVWEALRQTVECLREGDTATAQGILNAVNVTLPTGHLEDGCYDERGNLYKMPPEILTDPTNLQSGEGEVDAETVIGIPADTKVKLTSDALDEQSLGLSKEILGEKHGVSVIDKGKDAVPEDAVQLKCRLSDRGTDVVLQLGKSQKAVVLASRIKEAAQLPTYTRIEIFYLGKKLDQKKTLEEQDYREDHVLNIFVVGAPR